MPKLTHIMSNNLQIHDDSELDFNVSYSSAVSTNNLSFTSFQDVLSKIQTGSGDLKKHIEKIRTCADLNLRRSLKKIHLPIFNMGMFKEHIRKDANFEQTQH